MWTRFNTSWSLVKSTFGIIQRDKKLLLFPAVNLVFVLAILFFFTVPILFINTGHPFLSFDHWKVLGNKLVEISPSATPGEKDEITLKPLALTYLAAMYFVSMFASTFLNVAFYSEILAAFRGDAVSIQRGLKFASTRFWSIVAWSLMAGIVGYIIQQIENRVGFVGRIITGLIGAAWSVASVFAIPVIVHEEASVNPLSTLKQSALTLKRTWGEALVGYVGFSGISFVVFLLSMLFLIGAFVPAVIFNNVWIALLLGALWFLALLAFTYFMNTAKQVFLCALYLFASEGAVTEPYTADMFNAAWKTKKK